MTSANQKYMGRSCRCHPTKAMGHYFNDLYLLDMSEYKCRNHDDEGNVCGATWTAHQDTPKVCRWPREAGR